MKGRKIKLAALSLALLGAALAPARPGAEAAQQGRAGKAPPAARPIDAGRLFAKNCATCHGRDGRAKTLKSKLHVHARDLTDPAWQAEASDERLTNSVTHGRGRMPAFGQKLTREEIAALVAYVRGLKK